MPAPLHLDRAGPLHPRVVAGDAAELGLAPGVPVEAVLHLLDAGVLRPGVAAHADRAGLHVGAFGEGALKQDAAHLRPHLGDAEGRGAPGQFVGQGHGARFHRHHPDFRGLLLLLLLVLVVLLAAGAQGQGYGQQGGGEKGMRRLDLHIKSP